MKFKIGQRVKHNYLGKGKIVKTFKGLPFVFLVLFDKTPDVRYNMCQNPTPVFKTDLEGIDG
jgi:hypothetical protein